MPFDRITIINITPPSSADINAELQWVGAALGLFGERDKDSSCFRIFVSLVRASRTGNPLSSDDIAGQTALSRGTVVHHLNRLRDAGLIAAGEQGYQITGASLRLAIANLQADLHETLRLLDAVAKDIEEKLR